MIYFVVNKLLQKNEKLNRWNGWFHSKNYFIFPSADVQSVSSSLKTQDE